MSLGGHIGQAWVVGLQVFSDKFRIWLKCYCTPSGVPLSKDAQQELGKKYVYTTAVPISDVKSGMTIPNFNFNFKNIEE